MTDEGNPNWVGNKVSYFGIHTYMRRRVPKPEFCQECRIRKACDMANVSGRYLRDLSDWRYLCRRCHMEEDGRFKNLKQFRGGN